MMPAGGLIGDSLSAMCLAKECGGGKVGGECYVI